jgi:DNA polymerase-3 subunit chi
VGETAARIDFYILSDSGRDSRLRFACRLSEKAYNMNTHVYAHTPSPEQADRLDQMLWTFRDGSFVPHARFTADAEQRAPISIGTPEIYSEAGELLINLCDVVPTFYSGFERIAEIVAADESSRKAGRERFRHYRDLGADPATHNIK